MAQRISNSFINTNVPNSYFTANVKSSPIGVGTSGNVGIVGEADGGPASYGVDNVDGVMMKDSFFSPDQLQLVESIYVSGPIVDAFRALIDGNGSAKISGSPNRIYIGKTNVGSKAQSELPNSYGVFKDKNFGVSGNLYKYQITQSLDEVAPEITGDVISAFGVALDGLVFKMRIDGGAEATVTLGTGGHADMAALIVELNSLLPSGITASEGTASDSLKLTYDEDASANLKGYGKSFELIDSTPGDLAIIGHEEGLIVSSVEPEVQVDITRSDIGLDESFLSDAQVALSIGYEGTSATVDITDDLLTTTVAGGAGANLSIALSQFSTLGALVEYIDSQTGYSASVVSSLASYPPQDLDNVSSIGICSTNEDLMPGRIKRSAIKFSQVVNQSVALDFELTGEAGIPQPRKRFLSGGAKGSTSSANVLNAMADLETVAINFLVPLFSRDATEDIVDGLTDASSTYTIAAINALAKNHVIAMSKPKIKKHRSAVVSLWDSYNNIKSQAASLSHYRVSLAFQKASQVNSLGNTTNFLPWYTACVAVGMQVAGFYKAIFNKAANIISFEDPSGFDSGSPGQLEDALDSGLLILERSIAGSSWVSDQTTYKLDTNFVYNSLQAVYAMDLVALDLTQSFKTAFVGESLADVDSSTALSYLASKMELYRKQKLLVASSDAPMAYKNAKIRINGPIMEISVEIKLGTALYFIPIFIEISQVSNES